MLFRLLLLVAVTVLAITTAGVADAQPRRTLAGEESQGFRGVGRLNIAGTRFCSATLISEQVAVTAAHCLYHPRTQRMVPLSRIRFVAGLRHEEAGASRGVSAAAVVPGFVPRGVFDLRSGRADMALVRLNPPIGSDEAGPLPIGGALRAGDLVTIVSHARNRPRAASVQAGCPIQAVVGEIATTRCTATFGASGSPVLTGPTGDLRLAGIVSGIGGMPRVGGQLTFIVMLAPHLATLQARLAGAGMTGGVKEGP